ncbi:MAG: META domain-containing protein [Lentisphaeria bacterium]|nr:META domain-containing protein [Lentisphaeria bacterium]
MREQCPVCGSTDLVLTNGTYSTGCGCLGLLLFGWVGLLLGLLGLGNYELVCKHCGSRWPVGKPHQANRGTGCGCFFLLLIIIIIIAAFGCKSHNLSIENGAWQLKSVQTRTPITLFVEKDGSFYGYGGVNRYFGKLAVPFKNGKFAIKGTPGVTMMFGPDLNKEQNYLKALTAADQWKINSNRELELYSNGKKTAVFEYKPEIRPNK